MTVPPKFSDAMRELEDEHNMNMSVSSNKLKHLRVQESDGDECDLILHGCESMAPKRSRGKSIH